MVQALRPHAGPNFLPQGLKVPSLVRGKHSHDFGEGTATLAKVQDLLQLVRPVRASQRHALLNSTCSWSESTLGSDAERHLILGPALCLDAGTEDLLQRVFVKWCSFGDRLNTTQLTSAKWTRLLREARLLRQPGARAPRAYRQLSSADANVIFAKVAQALNQGARLHFPAFVKALQVVAGRVSDPATGGLSFPALVQEAFGREACADCCPDPTAGATEDEAVQEFLRAQERVVRHLYCYFACTPETNVPLSQDTSVMGSSSDETLVPATLVPAIVLSVKDELKPGEESYSPGSSKVSTKTSVNATRRAAFGAHPGSGLSFPEFQAFLRAASIAPGLVPPIQAHAAFLASGAARPGEGEPRLSEPGFAQALARLAVLAYAESPYTELFPTPVAKVEAFFARVLQVNSHGEAGCMHGLEDVFARPLRAGGWAPIPRCTSRPRQETRGSTSRGHSPACFGG